MKPIQRGDLEVAISLARRRFEEFETLRKETSDLRQALQDRKVIERAKAILMKAGQLHENDAFRQLQKLASRENKKLVQVAEMIVTAEQAFAPGTKIDAPDARAHPTRSASGEGSSGRMRRRD